MAIFTVALAGPALRHLVAVHVESLDIAPLIATLPHYHFLLWIGPLGSVLALIPMVGNMQWHAVLVAVLYGINLSWFGTLCIMLPGLNAPGDSLW